MSRRDVVPVETVEKLYKLRHSSTYYNHDPRVLEPDSWLNESLKELETFGSRIRKYTIRERARLVL